MIKQDNYKTKDIFEAAWIYSNNINLLFLEPDDRYSWFVFSDKQTCSKLSNEYWSNNANGEIKGYVNSLKTLKDLVFSRSKSNL